MLITRANVLLCTKLSNIQNIIDENLIKNKQVIPYQINNNLFLLCSLTISDSRVFPVIEVFFSSLVSNVKNHVLFIYFLLNSIFVDEQNQHFCDCGKICLNKFTRAHCLPVQIDSSFVLLPSNTRVSFSFLLFPPLTSFRRLKVVIMV